jgi:4-hydroxy-tetrahydrodipicolinate reductase
MKFLLIGYGKMGKEIEKIAIARGHEIIGRISSADNHQLTSDLLSKSDIAIEFTRPDAVMGNIDLCFNSRIPVVTGTTGWYDKLDEVKTKCIEQHQSFFYASNFSIGVNIFFELNRTLASMMNHQKEYDIAIEEIHHTQKLDSPSGTAITLANDLIQKINRKSNWKSIEVPVKRSDNTLYIHSERRGEVTGTHIVKYTSPNDLIEIRHESFNREGFATGAVLAAEWLKGKTGFFTMRDMLSTRD